MLWGLYGLGLRGGMGAIGCMAISHMAIVNGYWLLVIGYGYWVSVMGMVIDYMDRDRFGLLECGIRTSFIWV
jgi:hypothetical protein